LEATECDVVLFGALVWLNALAAADLDFAPVFSLVSTLDALDAVAGLVTFVFVISSPRNSVNFCLWAELILGCKNKHEYLLCQ